MAKKMKLVEILARELKEWPINSVCAVQDDDGEIKFSNHPHPDIGRTGNVWIRKDKDKQFSFRSVVASDRKTSIITREEWESERAKLAKPKGGKDSWVRHRGRKCPVERGVLVDVRHRDGEIFKGIRALSSIAAAEMNWRHDTPHKAKGEIMAWRIAEGIKQDHSPAVLAEELPREFETPNPILWRDRVKELDERKSCLDAAHAKHTEDIAKERQELIGKLASQGFQLIGVAVEDIGDILDPKSWLKGDILRAVNSANGKFSVGKYYVLSEDVGASTYCSISADDRGESNGWGSSNFEWSGRPSK